MDLPVGERPADVAGAVGGATAALRTWFGQGRREDERSAALDRVAALAGESAEPSFLVLRGAGGSGRTGLTVGGLVRAGHRAPDPGDVTVFCPDSASAAAVARQALSAGLALDLRLAAEGGLPEAAGAAGAGPANHGDVVVMLDVERFGPEARYRIAQRGRGRRLLMTVDPAATPESWENLFLTTPRAADVLTVAGPRDQTRAVWDETRHHLPDDLAAGSRAGRRDRGRIDAEYAANLDQCVARVRLGLEEGLLPDVFRLSAPMSADLDFLAASLRDQGWLVIDEEEFDRLFLPGPCDLLAAVSDVLAATGVLKRHFGPSSDALSGETDENLDEGDDPGFPANLLAAMPGGGSGLWPPLDPPDPHGTSLAELHASLILSRDAAPAFAHAHARGRTAALLRVWGGLPLADLPRHPLFAAWWHTLAADLDRPRPVRGRPLVLLSTADRTPGPPVAGAVHLCLGSEDPRVHYRFLARTAERFLVLYQDRSPLADAGAQ